MCPNMHFGIIMAVKGTYDYQKAADSAAALADAHPFLRSVIAAEGSGDKLFYSIGNASRIEINEMPSSAPKDDFAAISGQNWNVFERGLLKIFFIRTVRKATALQCCLQHIIFWATGVRLYSLLLNLRSFT